MIYDTIGIISTQRVPEALRKNNRGTAYAVMEKGS